MTPTSFSFCSRKADDCRRGAFKNMVGARPAHLAAAGGQVVKIRPEEVLRRQPQNTSLMPGNLHELMTLKELADLVAFLKAAR